MEPATPYSFSLSLPLKLSEAETIVRQALQRHQFGIISEIDIQAKLKEKLGVDHPPHKILGACNPKLAYQALQENLDVALALPCNVVLREEAGRTIISAYLPTVALRPFSGEKVCETADIAQKALAEAFDELSSALHPIPHSP